MNFKRPPRSGKQNYLDRLQAMEDYKKQKLLNDRKYSHLPIAQKGATVGMSYEQLNEVIEFLITFNIIDYRQALDIRTKAIPFLKG